MAPNYLKQQSPDEAIDQIAKDSIKSKTINVNAILIAIVAFMPQIMEILQAEWAVGFVRSVGGEAGFQALQVGIIVVAFLNILLRYLTKQAVSTPQLIKAALDAYRQIRGIRKAAPVIAFAFLGFVAADSLQARTIAVPHITVDGYETSLSINNPTAREQIVPDFWKFTKLGFGDLLLQPFQTVRLGQFPEPGMAGIIEIDIPEPLIPYVEIVDPVGQITRIADLGAEISVDQRVQFQDLLTEDEFASYVFVHAREPSTVTLEYCIDGNPVIAESYNLLAGEVVIPRVPEGMNRVLVRLGSQIGGWPVSPIRAFALISHQPEGEHTLVRPVPVFD